ncbi:MAG: YciI family protein [Pseudomonadota bacterium]|nr:YciI family protein [Pseudomonadota bacterium]
MLYAIISKDVNDSLEKRSLARADHIDRLNMLVDEGRLIIAGPHPAIDAYEPGPAGFSGSLIIAEFATLEEAEKWANDDPYVSANVYKEVTVKPFKQVLP